MAAEPRRLHVVLFPFLAYGHMIPALDLARLFAARNNVKATIITTPGNAPAFTRSKDSNVDVEIFRFPTQEAGLPDGCEKMEQASKFGMVQSFLEATGMLQDQLESYLKKVRPDCLVADMFYPWATKSSEKFNVPRLVLHGTSYFSLCAQDVILEYRPFKNVSSDDEICTLSPFPDEVGFYRTQLPEGFWSDKGGEYRQLMETIMRSEVGSYGVMVNSFYELEPSYADFYKRVLGRKTWHVGPVSFAGTWGPRGEEASIDEHECLTWLQSKKSASVIYICFGTETHHTAPQLHEIAIALEKSEENFVWVIRNEVCLPTGFEERTVGKGLVIRGWAPQILILGHEAVGAFVTHCGWNSTLEGISAGVPMVTWPMFADQFFNEKLVTQILRTGVSVGAKKWGRVSSVEDVINGEAIAKVLSEIIKGEKAEMMRKRAKELKEMAQNAAANDGPSQSDLSALINELRGFHSRTKKST